jgi:phospholipid/cholesterol/gamma-HCH transport system ATP-binding protein
MSRLIEFKDVVKKFNGVPVLNGVTFGVEKGEVLCVVGPSGTGKSVTLKHLVRLLTPTSGTITVDGIDVASCSDADLVKLRGRIGYLFQGGALLAWMTVAENVALPLEECTRLSDREIAVRVRHALRAVELVSAADKYPAEISGGMQKRAGLARAIVRESDIVLYDEPTSGLDPVTSVTINKLIRRLNRELGITSVVVTHDLQGALAIADHILLLKDGKAVECSTPENFAKSENKDVREFLAAMKGETI